MSAHMPVTFRQWEKRITSRVFMDSDGLALGELTSLLGQMWEDAQVAAAPETAVEQDRLRSINAALLEALEHVAKVITERMPGWTVLEEIEAAIAQAKGETT